VRNLSIASLAVESIPSTKNGNDRHADPAMPPAMVHTVVPLPELPAGVI